MNKWLNELLNTWECDFKFTLQVRLPSPALLSLVLSSVSGNHSSQGPQQLASRYAWDGKCWWRMWAQGWGCLGKSWRLALLWLGFHLRWWLCPCYGSVYRDSLVLAPGQSRTMVLIYMANKQETNLFSQHHCLSSWRLSAVCLSFKMTCLSKLSVLNPLCSNPYNGSRFQDWVLTDTYEISGLGPDRYILEYYIFSPLIYLGKSAWKSVLSQWKKKKSLKLHNSQFLQYYRPISIWAVCFCQELGFFLQNSNTTLSLH